MNIKIKRILTTMFLILSTFILIGCVHETYGYIFHFYVDGGNGTIEVENSQSFNPTINLCSESSFCELNCNEESYCVKLNGGKNGERTLTFTATPTDGYQVKEWIFNGKVVEDNKTNTFIATITSEENYNGIIAVRFEKTEKN